MRAISQAMNQPGISVEIENDRFVAGEQQNRSPLSVKPCGCSVLGCSLKRSTTLMKRILISGNSCRNSTVAAKASCVGISPAEAITRSGSLPWSLLAQSQMPMPFVQCVIASSMFRY